MCLLITVDNILVRKKKKSAYIKPSKNSKCVHSPQRPVVPVSAPPRRKTMKNCLSQMWTSAQCCVGGGGLQDATRYIKHKSIDLFVQQPQQVVNLTSESHQAQGQSVITHWAAINGTCTMISLTDESQKSLTLTGFSGSSNKPESVKNLPHLSGKPARVRERRNTLFCLGCVRKQARANDV